MRLKDAHHRQEQELGGPVRVAERVLERFDAWRHQMDFSPSRIQPEHAPVVIAHEQITCRRPANEARQVSEQPPPFGEKIQ